MQKHNQHNQYTVDHELIIISVFIQIYIVPWKSGWFLSVLGKQNWLDRSESIETYWDVKGSAFQGQIHLHTKLHVAWKSAPCRSSKQLICFCVCRSCLNLFVLLFDSFRAVFVGLIFAMFKQSVKCQYTCVYDVTSCGVMWYCSANHEVLWCIALSCLCGGSAKHISPSPSLNARGYSLKCYIRLFTDSLNVHNLKKS